MNNKFELSDEQLEQFVGGASEGDIGSKWFTIGNCISTLERILTPAGGFDAKLASLRQNYNARSAYPVAMDAMEIRIEVRRSPNEAVQGTYGTCCNIEGCAKTIIALENKQH